MKNLFLLIIVCVYSIISSNSRLLEKITDQPLATKVEIKSSPRARRLRTIEDFDTFTGNSREDNANSDEFIRYYHRKAYLNKINPIRSESYVRKARNSSERQQRATRNATSVTARTFVAQTKPKPTLVKKPIPKYNEMDYEDDFQMKINRSPVNLVDSGEHEDDDFNLEDYDFDINHDEFIGRGKPLEPRLKHKDIQKHVELMKPLTKAMAPPETKTEVNTPASNQAISNKRERSVEVPKKSEKDDYYDDTTSTKAPEKPRELDDELNEDNEESKEYDSKTIGIRQIRSPLKINSYADNFGKKVSFKILSILPMFPQVPGDDKDFTYNSGHRHRKDSGFKTIVRI